jgi:regulator of RNase E activity RraA
MLSRMIPRIPVFVMTGVLSAGLAPLHAESAPEVADEVLLQLYKGARVTDVVDGLVTVGYMDVGVMQQNIAPLWRDEKTMEHRFAGIAVTVRYGPTNRPRNPGADLTVPAGYQAYRDWRGMWYSELSPEPFHEFLKPGSVLVMDNRDDNDTGSTGSKNILDWKERGAVGLVTAGGIRDIDEIILQKNPVYTNYYARGRGERIGRNEVLDVQRPVVVGGVTVYPGDVVVADSDGVVVVPRRVAVRVGQIAYQELVDDIAGRREFYQNLNLPMDETVRERERPEAFFRRLGLPANPNQP